ncbi:hypothetical protein AVEN_138367-1 [Araneus ventricosus]|uniref:Uncharacterized protein n=1 Tax=Araneus ventricosus TaxID=182803 RepID=A0A4Y2QHA1_ARAVE|nr:hypothetical protein AVEN_138367-1 [Araneus ventricosus]
MDSSAPFPLFSSQRGIGDINGRPFISHLSPKGPFKGNSPNCLLLISEQQQVEIRPFSIEVAWPITAGLVVRVLKIRRVEKNIKNNSTYYPENVLRPIFREKIPFLYPNDFQRVKLHQDKATSHTSKSSTAFPEKNED